MIFVRIRIKIERNYLSSYIYIYSKFHEIRSLYYSGICVFREVEFFFFFFGHCTSTTLVYEGDMNTP